MTQKLKYPVILVIFFFLFGCVHIISDKIRDQAVPDLQLKQVSLDPDSFKGKTVIWGGEIVETVNQKDGTSFVTIFQRPLNINDAPDLNTESEGRFIIKSDKYLDPYAYRKGRKITVGGVILGGENKREGEIDYWYTIVSAKEIYLWNESYYNDVRPFDDFYNPFWNYPYYYDHPHHQHHHNNRLPWPD
jgi:outer membrane lipoprotein